MKSYEKEVQQAFLDNEKAVLKKLEETYVDALFEINDKIERLLARKDAELQHVIYQVEYQKALKSQVETIIETLHNNEFETVSEYLTKSYEDGFIGAMYSLHKQNIPMIIPIDQRQVAKSIQHETKLSESLYDSLGKDTKRLSKQIAGEISRGISNAATYDEMSRNIASFSNIPKNRAMTIARTEAHRIQCTATADAQVEAKKRGADVVKQWDATLDGNTRPNHRKLDGQIREIDEAFEVDGYSPMYPGDFGDPAEDCNCRCALLQRARWALDESELETLKERAEFFDLDKTKDFDDFKKKYLKASESERVRSNAQKMNDDVQKRLIDRGIQVNIDNAVNLKEEAIENLKHLEKLIDEYNSTIVSYSVNKNIAGTSTEFGYAYMLNGRTSVSIIPKALKNIKAADSLGLGDKQFIGTTYHEFAHTLSQSKEKIDTDFWKEIRKIKKEYEGNRGNSNWFDVKISNYASKDIDEFLAESFTQAKLSDNPSEYSIKVLEVIDKYFKKK